MQNSAKWREKQRKTAYTQRRKEQREADMNGEKHDTFLVGFQSVQRPRGKALVSVSANRLSLQDGDDSQQDLLSLNFSAL